MPDLIKALQVPINAVRDNPLGLVALAFLLVAAVVVALKTKRHKQLLAHIHHLPQKDRLKALEIEMGAVKLRTGLSPEQWLKYRVRTYFFVAFLIGCAMALLVVALVLYSKPQPGKPAVSTTLIDDATSSTPQSNSPQTSAPDANASRMPVSETRREVKLAKLVQVRNDWGERQMAEDGIPGERIVTYESVVESGISHIRYRLPYLERLRKGGTVSGFNYLGSPFKWRYPELAVNAANNSSQLLVISQMLVTVVSSSVISEPILLFDDLSVNRLVIRNEGWDEVSNPVLRLAVSEDLPEGEIPVFAAETHEVPIASFEAMAKVPIESYVPSRLRQNSYVLVSGEIAYGHTPQRHVVHFKTRVSLQVRAAAGIPASHSYEVFFRAGEAPVTKQIDIAQEIKPGEADRFVIRLAADKSSHNRVKIAFRTADGQTLDQGEFLIDLFAPRSSSN